jgi:hypothetical protein
LTHAELAGYEVEVWVAEGFQIFNFFVPHEKISLPANWSLGKATLFDASCGHPV